MSMADWSTIPANNASVPGINWAEGMQPRDINDSARQLMADVKTWVLSQPTPLFINAADYGCVPNSSADQAAQLQAAIDAGVAQKKDVFVPFDMSISSIHLYRGVGLVGANRDYVNLTHVGSQPMVRLEPGPITRSKIVDIRFVGHGGAGDDIFYMEAQLSGGQGGWWDSRVSHFNLEGFAGIGFWLRGGNINLQNPYAFTLPHQFLDFNNVICTRKNTETSRCLVVTGQVGQLLLSGEGRMEAEYDGTSVKGCNITVGPEFNGPSGEKSDVYSAMEEDGDFDYKLKAGWTLADTTWPSKVTLTGSIQSGKVGVMVYGARSVHVTRNWVERIERYVVALESSSVTVKYNFFTGACHRTDNKGYAAFAGDNARVRVGANEFGSNPDYTYVANVNGIMVFTEQDFSHDTDNFEGKTSGTYRFHGVSGTTLTINHHKDVNVDGSGSPTIETLYSKHGPGQLVTLRCNTGELTLVTSGNIVTPGNSTYKLRAAEAATLVKIDGVGSYEWMLVGVAYVSRRVDVPLTATSPGFPGDWAADATHIYAYTGDGTTHSWVRSTAGTF